MPCRSVKQSHDICQWRDGQGHAIIRFDLQAGTKGQDDLHSCSRNGFPEENPLWIVGILITLWVDGARTPNKKLGCETKYESRKPT